MSLIRPADCIGCQLWASGHKERFTETKRARGQPLWTNTNTASPGRTAACRQKKICSCQSASQFVCLDGIIRPQKATEQHRHSAISIPKGDSDRAERELQQRNYNSLVLFCELAAWKDIVTRSHNKRLLSVTSIYCSRSVCVWTSCECQQWAVVGCEDQYYFTHK